MDKYFKIDLREDKHKGPGAENSFRIKYFDTAIWQEEDNDVFWIKILFTPIQEFVPVIKFSIFPHVYEVRDYSHMFFASDNFLGEMQIPYMALYTKEQIISTPIFKSKA